MSPVRVVVVDDHPMFRLGMTTLLEALDGVVVVGDADSAGSALDVVEQQRPDVVLMDVHLPDESGVEATRRIASGYPGVAVLVITMLEDDATVFAALRAGARGYLVKGAGPEEIERAIHAVASGDVLLGSAVADHAAGFFAAGPLGATPFPDLSIREREVLDLMARGLDNTAIARRLVISPKTVRNHVSNVLTKLQVADRGQAIAKARDAGLGDST